MSPWDIPVEERPRPSTREELDRHMELSRAGDPAPGGLVLNMPCHPDEGLDVCYYDGSMWMKCHVCGASAAVIAVGYSQ